MSLIEIYCDIDQTKSRGSKMRLQLVLFNLILLAVMLVLISCTFGKDQGTSEAIGTVQAYLDAMQSGSLDEARSYWTDINNHGSTWNMVAHRDMEHVTQGHKETFEGGVEIVEYRFKRMKDLDKDIGVFNLDVQVQPDNRIMKLEVGLVRFNGRWYIYSIYPGTW